jgi:hypothetical protein
MIEPIPSTPRDIAVAAANMRDWGRRESNLKDPSQAVEYSIDPFWFSSC